MKIYWNTWSICIGVFGPITVTLFLTSDLLVLNGNLGHF